MGLIHIVLCICNAYKIMQIHAPGLQLHSHSRYCKLIQSYIVFLCQLSLTLRPKEVLILFLYCLENLQAKLAIADLYFMLCFVLLLLENVIYMFQSEYLMLWRYQRDKILFRRCGIMSHCADTILFCLMRTNTFETLMA